MKEILGFGIAGNFAFHLEQAGEFKDFIEVGTDDKYAPKGIFPFFLPGFSGYLGNFCFNNTTLVLPKDKDLNVQIEAEIALRCEILYKNGLVDRIVPKSFMAFNDASIRNNKTATKISQKKNFSSGSKGCGNEITIDQFNENGICQNYSLVSFLRSGDEFFRYGECAKLSTYSYFYDKLLEWIKDTFNSQKDFSVLENLSEILKKTGYKKDIIIAIGATRYEKKGENRFLVSGDEIFVVAFNHEMYNLRYIEDLVYNDEDLNRLVGVSTLKQVVK